MLDEGAVIKTSYGTYTLIGYMGITDIGKPQKLYYLKDVAKNLGIKDMDILTLQYMSFSGNFYGTRENDFNQPIQNIIRIPVSMDIDEDTKIIKASEKRKEWILKSKLLNSDLAQFKMVQIPEYIKGGIEFFRKFYLDMLDDYMIMNFCSDVEEIKPYHIYYRVSDAFYLYLGKNQFQYLGYDWVKTKNTSKLISHFLLNQGNYSFDDSRLHLKELNLDCSFLLAL